MTLRINTAGPGITAEYLHGIPKPPSHRTPQYHACAYTAGTAQCSIRHTPTSTIATLEGGLAHHTIPNIEAPCGIARSSQNYNRALSSGGNYSIAALFRPLSASSTRNMLRPVPSCHHRLHLLAPAEPLWTSSLAMSLMS